jgi:hypothetical protein
MAIKSTFLATWLIGDAANQNLVRMADRFYLEKFFPPA